MALPSGLSFNTCSDDLSSHCLNNASWAAEWVRLKYSRSSGLSDL
jgi:hypothetical protein